MFGGLFDEEREKGLYGTWKETNTKNVFNISLCGEFKKKKKNKKKIKKKIKKKKKNSQKKTKKSVCKKGIFVPEKWEGVGTLLFFIFFFCENFFCFFLFFFENFFENF